MRRPFSPSAAAAATREASLFIARVFIREEKAGLAGVRIPRRLCSGARPVRRDAGKWRHATHGRRDGSGRADRLLLLAKRNQTPLIETMASLINGPASALHFTPAFPTETALLSGDLPLPPRKKRGQWWPECSRTRQRHENRDGRDWTGARVLRSFREGSDAN